MALRPKKPRVRGEEVSTTTGSDGESPAEPNRWLLSLFQEEKDGLVKMLYRLLGQEADVLDALQDCFCKLAGRGEWKDLVSAKAYAYRTAMNIAIEMIRVRSRRRLHRPAIAAENSARMPDAVAPGQTCDDSIHRNGRLQEAVAGLPSHLRDVVVLRDLCEKSYEEVGRVLGIDPATARVYRRYAVVKLAENLGAEMGELERP